MPSPPPADAVDGAVDIAALSRCAALDLSPQRRMAVEAILSAWIPAANALSHKMSEPAHQSLMPVTAFTHARELPEDAA